MIKLAYYFSGILIDFKLRCITEADFDDNIYSNDGKRLKQTTYNRESKFKFTLLFLHIKDKRELNIHSIPPVNSKMRNQVS